MMPKKKNAIIRQVNNIKNMFLFYGFLQSPLTTKKIVSLIIRGFTKESIYLIGCDIHNKTSYLK